MISAMRKNRKVLAIVLWVVIIAFISTIFVVWGIGSNESNTNYVAKVNDVTISYEEYRNIYDQRVASLRQIFGDDVVNAQMNGADFQLTILNDIVNEKLIIKEADRLKIPVTDFELVQAISEIQAFHKDGYFDPETYVEALRSVGLTPAYFESTLADSLKVNKFNTLIMNSQSSVGEEAVVSEYKYRNTNATAEYFSVPVSNFFDQIETNLDNLTAYYQLNGESYRTPARIKLKYVVFDKNRYGDNVTVTDDEALVYYNGNLGSYTTPETFDMRNIGIVVRDPKNTTEMDAAKVKIQAAYDELKNGADFIAMVKKYSTDTFKTLDGLVKGVEKGVMPQEMGNAIAELKEGEFSEVIRTENGFMIIRMEKKNPAKVASFDSVKTAVKEKIKDEKLTGEFRKYVYDLYRDVLDTGNITAYTQKNPQSGLVLQETLFFSPLQASVPVLDNMVDMKNKIFTLGKTEVSQLITDGDKTYFFEVAEKEESFIPPMDTVKARVTEDYKIAEAKKIAAEVIAQQMQKDGFDKTAAYYKTRIQKTDAFLRTDAGLPFGNEQSLIKTIFASKDGVVLDKAYLNGNNVYGIKVNSIVKPTMDKLEADRGTIVAYIKATKEEEALKSYINTLRGKAKININPYFIESVENR